MNNFDCRHGTGAQVDTTQSDQERERGQSRRFAEHYAKEANLSQCCEVPLNEGDICSKCKCHSGVLMPESDNIEKPSCEKCSYDVMGNCILKTVGHKCLFVARRAV